MPLFFREIFFNICRSHSIRTEVKPKVFIKFIILNILQAFNQASHNHIIGKCPIQEFVSRTGPI